MTNKKTKVSVLLVAILVCGFIGAYFYAGGDDRSKMMANAEQMYLLVSPAFAQSLSLETTFLEEEAGMAIYVNTNQSLDLSVARTHYKTIEKETSEYIIGSFSHPDYTLDTDDFHCFVHKDGWIVVYYLNVEPISKIIDWSYYSAGMLTTTKLLRGLEWMGERLTANVTSAEYYNFHHPYADKWMAIIDDDSFNLKIPSEFTIFERSYSHFCDDKVEYGQITAIQLTPDTFHTLALYYSDYYNYDDFKIDEDQINHISSVYAGDHKIALILAYKES